MICAAGIVKPFLEKGTESVELRKIFKSSSIARNVKAYKKLDTGMLINLDL